MKENKRLDKSAKMLLQMINKKEDVKPFLDKDLNNKFVMRLGKDNKPIFKIIDATNKNKA